MSKPSELLRAASLVEATRDDTCPFCRFPGAMTSRCYRECARHTPVVRWFVGAPDEHDKFTRYFGTILYDNDAWIRTHVSDMPRLVLTFRTTHRYRGGRA